MKIIPFFPPFFSFPPSRKLRSMIKIRKRTTNPSHFCFNSVGIARGGETGHLCPRDIGRKRTPIRNYGPSAIATHVRANVFFLTAPGFSFFFVPLRISRGRFRENEWTLYPGLNLKHGRNRRSKSLASLAPRDNFSSYRDAPTELLQKRLLTDGDKRSMH